MGRRRGGGRAQRCARVAAGACGRRRTWHGHKEEGQRDVETVSLDAVEGAGGLRGRGRLAGEERQERCERRRGEPSQRLRERARPLLAGHWSPSSAWPRSLSASHHGAGSRPSAGGERRSPACEQAGAGHPERTIERLNGLECATGAQFGSLAHRPRPRAPHSQTPPLSKRAHTTIVLITGSLGPVAAPPCPERRHRSPRARPARPRTAAAPVQLSEPRASG